MVCGAVSTGSVKKTCRWGRVRRRAAACIRVYAPFGVRGERIHRIHVYKRAGKPLNYVLANCIQKEDGLPRQRARWLAMTEWVMSLLLRWRHKRKPMLRTPPPPSLRGAVRTLARQSALFSFAFRNGRGGGRPAFPHTARKIECATPKKSVSPPKQITGQSKAFPPAAAGSASPPTTGRPGERHI